MDGQAWLQIGSIATTIIVGIILAKQIKSQKQLIEQYKGYIEAVNPEKVITLHERQISQIESINSKTIEELRTQVLELGLYANHIIHSYERTAKNLNEPDLFNRIAVINRNMPNCAAVLEKINEYQFPKTPNP